MDLVVTHALILGHSGIVKADIGVRDGRIAGIGIPGRSVDVVDFGTRLFPDQEVVTVARIEGVGPGESAKQVRAVLDAQAEKWGGPLLNHLIYARRPTIFRGARAMWGGLETSGLLDPTLVALVNRRVAALNGCEF